MQIQADYETDITLAVFRTMAQLEAAVQQLVPLRTRRYDPE